MLNLPTPLQDQLLDAAQRFATDAQPLSELLMAMVQDVERAIAEPLEIFPVCHHSPSSALQMVQRLRQKSPQVIYIELCEDLLPIVENLRDCKLPIALQAFASESATFPPEEMPLSVVAPLTEASAEYQAIAYALNHPETELVFVDRAVDFVFQWQAQVRDASPDSEEAGVEAPPEEATMHGTAVGVAMGDLTPSFDQFLEFLLRNSNTRHFAEWWDQYVEQALIGADYPIYRQVMVLIGSLMRRLGRRSNEIETDRLRERYMWTRIKQHLTAHQIASDDAIFICGAFHSIQDVEEFGVSNDRRWEIPDRTSTQWLYGLIPSSFVAIEYQFHHPAGTATLAESTWKKSLKVSGVKAFSLVKKGEKPKAADQEQVRRAESVQSSSLRPDALTTFLTRPPDFAAADTEQLLQWCADIVGLARKNGYLASTADSIAIYQTSMLLANLRNRQHPTPYDFQDAAITCLEKDRTPKKRTIAQVCQILLGGDRVGVVGYASLPPLAQNVYDRLAPLNVNLLAQTNQRALIDFKRQPNLLPCSDVLWRLNYLAGNGLVQPIMGERTLGHKPLQESWEIRIGKQQRQIIMLGYEGVTIEQVLEYRLRRTAFDSQARASVALKAAEDSLLYLHSSRLTQELGEHAITLLSQETGAEDAPQIFDRVRRLVHYYRTTPAGLPAWVKHFVTTGYSHYTTLLPQAFGDRGTSPEQIAGMLGFILTLESLALSLGCNRSQLLIGVKQASQEAEDPAKLGLLWTTEWLLNLRSLEQMRDFFDQVLTNPLRISALPDYLNGFILALTFAPRMSRFVVELLSQLFASVPDPVLLPWLPNLILKLRPHAQLLPTLIQEAASNFPNSLAEFDHWQPHWSIATDATASPASLPTAQTLPLSESDQQIRRLLFEHPETAEQLARLLGIESITWNLEAPESAGEPATSTEQPLSERELRIQELLQMYPVPTATLAALLKN
jgi:hypothetical protein